MNYYMTNFILMYDHKIDSIKWDNIPSFEKQIYIDILMKRLNEGENNNNQPPPQKSDVM